MDLLLQKDLPHQTYAVEAVNNVFHNVAVNMPFLYYTNPLINIYDSNIESNIRDLQKGVKNAECSFLPAKDYLHIDVKMETGTGKTFVYTKTMFELHQKYGFNKFVIAVPSLPIKEGIKSFIEDGYVRKFFSDTCGYNCEIVLCTVDAIKKQKKGKKYFPSAVREYVTGSDKIKNRIYALLVNMALLTGSTTGLLTRSDYDSPVENFFRPLDAIGATKPIIIIDEPHRFSRNQKAYDVIEKNLRPQCVIRYGATFPDRTFGSGKNKTIKKDYCNLIYNLDAYASFEQGLIKGIAKEHFAPATNNDEKVKVLSISNRSVRLQHKTRTMAKVYELSKGDPLSIISRDFGNLYISAIAGKKMILLSNGTEKKANEEFEVDIFANSYQEEMVRLGLKRHFETERENFNGDDPIKIKTLALFFIDDVYSYRSKKGGGVPFIKEMFNRILRETIEGLLPKLTVFEKEYKEYLLATLKDIESCQAGYFAQDNNDSDENIRKEVDIILRDKKSLLVIRNEDGTFNTRRFLFSKWTLKEGWDNPNVFTIVKLRSSGSEISKLQEVGRGLRLPVNTIGSRVSNREFLLNYIVDFSESDFAEKLIKEINGECGRNNNFISDVQLEKIACSRNMDTNILLAQMLMDGLVDINKKIMDGKLNELLQKYPEIQTTKMNGKIKDRNKDKEEKIIINKDEYDKIKELWMLLNQKYTLQYDDEIDEKITLALPEIIISSLVDTIISSVRSEIKTEDGQMAVTDGGSVPHVIKKKMKYGDFLKFVNKSTNIPIVKIHRAFCEANKKKAINPYKINERTAGNIISKFTDWKYDNLKGHFSYKKADIPVVRTALTHSDGTPVDAIAKLYIGAKDADGMVNKNYLYNSLAHDSDLELENIRADIDSVIVYGKIPRRSIAIPTIDGQTYSPDFMYLLKQKDGARTLNLVVETKDYEHGAEIRKAEEYRIECARVFFEALKADGINVKFIRQLKNDKMVSIIDDVLK